MPEPSARWGSKAMDFIDSGASFAQGDLLGGTLGALGLSEANKAKNAAKAASRLHDIKQMGKSAGMCFVAGTQVLVEGQDGTQATKPIEQIKVGDKVLSRDENTGAQAFKRVLQTFVTHPTKLTRLTYKRAPGSATRAAHGDHRERTQKPVGATGFWEERSEDSGTAGDGKSSGDDPDGPQVLLGTPVHPFWSVTRQSWVEMGELKPSERLLLSDGSLAIVESVEAAPAPLSNDGEPVPFTTYNFEVEDWHTYFVKPKHAATAAPSVWVHNTGFKPCDEIIDAYKRHPDLVKKMNLDPKVNDWLNKNVLPNKAPVVRGGTNTPESIAKGTGTHPSGIKGFSAESAPVASIQDLAKNLPGNYGKVGVTTVGDVRRVGGDVTPTRGRSPTHATVSGLSPEAASKLLNPVVPNPGKK